MFNEAMIVVFNELLLLLQWEFYQNLLYSLKAIFNAAILKKKSSTVYRYIMVTGI